MECSLNVHITKIFFKEHSEINIFVTFVTLAKCSSICVRWGQSDYLVMDWLLSASYVFYVMSSTEYSEMLLLSAY